MQLRTFVARDMREALAQVRSEMGDDAVIVASQRAKGGGIMIRVAFDTPVANANEAIEIADGPENNPEAVEFVGSFEQIFHRGLIRRLRGDELPAPSRSSKSFSRAEFLSLLRSHRAPDALGHPLAEAAEKSGLTDMTLALASALDRRMRLAPILHDPPKTLLLVGPSGAGKTAIAAKIAAHARLASRKVKLLATDTAGAGAIARLETFARHLGVEAGVVERAEDLALTAKAALEDGIFIIVDTAGFDPRNAQARTAFAALSRISGVETLGVVSATGDAEEISEVAGALVTLGARRLAVTGLDVTRRFGALLAAATQGAELAYVTRSPFVSGGLETLSPLTLARMLIEANTGNADNGSAQ